MSIGQHKIGKMLVTLRASLWGGFNGIFGGASYQHPISNGFNVDGVEASELPRAPLNPYRKRPVKLHYSKNDFHMFNLPSEKAFLLAPFDYNDLFGER